MKITKLRTSKQFGWWIKTMTIAEFVAVHGKSTIDKPIDECKYHLRNEYDAKISKPLEYGMFINSLSEPRKPPAGMSCLPFTKELEEYNQAERKVMFFPERIEHGSMLRQHTLNLTLGKHVIIIDDNDKFYIKLKTDTHINLKHPIETLEDLAYFTNGELEIKNFEL